MAIVSRFFVPVKSSNTTIVPSLFSTWAVYNNRQPATRFNIGREEKDSYSGRANGLKTKGLEDSVELVWNSIPRFDRNFMASMFPSRPALLNVNVHITPTIRQANRWSIDMRKL